MHEPEHSWRAEALVRLERDGILERDHERHRTSRRWKGAMARAAAILSTAEGGESFDLRVPIAMALVELYGDDPPEEELAHLVQALLPIETAELVPALS